jgi:hypothetical protein
MTRRKRQIHKLQWPPWLAEWAAQDSPPATLTESLRSRFEAAGVVEFVPADIKSREFLLPEQHERANAIGVGIDGLPCAEALDDSPTRTADALERLCTFVQRFDRLRLLRLAAIDMDFVASAARALASGEHATLRAFARVLETGIIVTYARPYLESNRPALGKKWRPNDPDDLALHLIVIDEYRSAYHAHSDRTPRRTLLDTADLLGLDEAPTYAEAWHGFSAVDLERLADLAYRQAVRLAAAADEVGELLGERRMMPSYPQVGPRVDYRFDDEIEAAFERLRASMKPDAEAP